MNLCELIKSVVELGVRVEVFHEEYFSADMNTGAKSRCVITEEPDGLWANMRYDERRQIECLDDVIEAVYRCDHGRGYFSQWWLDVFQRVGLRDPRIQR